MTGAKVRPVVTTFLSGFCNPSNRQHSHERCPETLLGLQCRCACHIVCSLCKVRLIADPGHPGSELGDWFVHPGAHDPLVDLVGHTAALMRER